VTWTIFSASGCIYDPPPKGKDIFILNQSDENIFVTDTLFIGGTIRQYDSFLVNKKLFVEVKGNSIRSYSRWRYFLSKKKSKNMRQQFTLYFIEADDLSKSYEQIKANTLYKVFSADLDEIEESKLNYVFYYKDSIILMHEYDQESIKKENN